jgi:hypothetical protein
VGLAPTLKRRLTTAHAGSRFQPNFISISHQFMSFNDQRRRAFGKRRGDEPVHSMDEAVSRTFSPRPRLGSPSFGNFNEQECAVAASALGRMPARCRAVSDSFWIERVAARIPGHRSPCIAGLSEETRSWERAIGDDGRASVGAHPGPSRMRPNSRHIEILSREPYSRGEHHRPL